MKSTTILLTGCALLAVASCGQKFDNTEALRGSGDYARWQGRWADAADDYQQIAAAHPGDWQAQYRLGESLLTLGDATRAREALEIAETIRPTNADVADLLARAMLAEGNVDRLYKWLRQRAEMRQTARAWQRFAQYAMALDDPDTATVAIDTAIAMHDGSTADPYLVAAELAQRLDDTDLAITRLQQAWNIDPENSEINAALRELDVVPGPTMTGRVNDQ